MDSISVQVCAYWVARKIIDMAVEKKLSTIRAAPRRLRIDVAGAYVVAAVQSISVVGRPSEHHAEAVGPL